MFKHLMILSSLPPISLTEIFVVLAVASVAYFIVFNNFEKHLPAKRRITKLFVVVGMLAVLGILFGRYIFWGVIALMTTGQIYLHGVYFPKHGINGLTAEPHEEYLEVIAKMKGNK
ncbi:MAG: hypothetical protein IPP66_15950 [Anaerolineales bacterium]|nr:hypothetical protein [Anaerolineales bacterium]